MAGVLKVNNKIFRIMKKIKFFAPLAGIGLLAIMFVVSCSKSEGDDEPVSFETDYFGFAVGTSGEKDGVAVGNGGEGIPDANTQAGIVTAGEWCDLTHWSFWSKLMLGNNFSDKSDYWQFYTNNRIPVKVTDASGKALPGVKVKLLHNGEGDPSVVWETVTDNHGLAECWVGLFQKTEVNPANLRISVNGEVMDGNPKLCPLDSLLQSEPLNTYVCKKAPSVSQQADIAFIVDATGSMMDEIDFLKQDLVDIINKVKSVRPGMKMRTAALFYRDEGDEYVTRHQNFTDNVNKTASFVKNQSADGGGDYPEAVHTALEKTLQDLSWDNNARTRLAFMVLDAPAHHETQIIRSLQQSVATCAKLGIKLIPVAASGVDKNTEFMLRFFANATGGTYVFLTDHSGVGNSHMAASVGEYEVEQLNNLLIRLISSYTE